MRARLVCRDLWRSSAQLWQQPSVDCSETPGSAGGRRAMGLGRLEGSVAMRLPAEPSRTCRSGAVGWPEPAKTLACFMHVTDGDCPMSSRLLATVTPALLVKSIPHGGPKRHTTSNLLHASSFEGGPGEAHICSPTRIRCSRRPLRLAPSTVVEPCSHRHRCLPAPVGPCRIRPPSQPRPRLRPRPRSLHPPRPSQTPQQPATATASGGAGAALVQPLARPPRPAAASRGANNTRPRSASPRSTTMQLPIR